VSFLAALRSDGTANLGGAADVSENELLDINLRLVRQAGTLSPRQMAQVESLHPNGFPHPGTLVEVAMRRIGPHVAMSLTLEVRALPCFRHAMREAYCGSPLVVQAQGALVMWVPACRAPGVLQRIPWLRRVCSGG
jgi:hypothetical protein